MRPTSADRDFYDPDVPTDANPSRLREVILAQAFEPGGAAVLLHTSATLDLTEDLTGDVTGDVTGDAPEGPQDLVEQVATELGLDDVPPELFTADSYVVLSALGERLLPGGS